MTDYDINNSKLISEKLDGEWQASKDKVTAVKDLENHKGVKYGEEILQEYGSDAVDLSPDSFKGCVEGLATTDLKGKYLKRVNRIRKMVEADKVRLLSGEDLPVFFVFFKNGDYRGAFLVAPRIQEERK